MRKFTLLTLEKLLLKLYLHRLTIVSTLHVACTVVVKTDTGLALPQQNSGICASKTTFTTLSVEHKRLNWRIEESSVKVVITSTLPPF